MNTQRKIVFTAGQETGLVIEKDGFKNSIFFDEYKHALATVDAIWNRQENAEVGRAAMDSNIVAFCGDRGEGKTSCMLTVQKILSNNSVFNQAVVDELMIMKPDWKVETLDMVDPSFFDEQHNVIELVIGQLYEKFAKTVRDDRSNTDYSLRDDLFHTFERTKSHLVFLNKKSESLYDNLEDLDVLAANMMLRDSISDLMKLYLRYMGKKDGRIILCLDDLDLNMKEGYAMVEQIRKYLNNRYCILFVAVNIEQLSKVIGSSFNQINKTFFPTEQCMEMANKYITKLFPAQNMVIMPHVSEFMERKLQIVDEPEKRVVYKHETLKEGVTKLIYQKTRYLFYNVKGEASYIVPTRLRELRHLLGMLLPMEDFENNEYHTENKLFFKNYFFRSWINCLTPQDQLFVHEITNTSEVAKINHLVVSYLREHLIPLIEVGRPSRGVAGVTYGSLLNRICDTTNMAYNISVGDVVYAMSQLSQNVVDESTHRLLFFIKSFYSMRLYDYYDYVTDNKEYYPPLSSDTDVYHESDWYQHVNKLQKFVNGAVFTYEPGSLIPRDQEDGVARDLRELKTSGIYDLMRNLQQTIKEKGKVAAYSDMVFRQHFKCCEFIALTTARNSRYSAMQSVDLNRRTGLPAHLDSFHAQSKGLTFDVMSIFTNLINVEYAYRRFDEVFPEFWSIAKGNSWSLLQLMIQSASRSNKALSLASFSKGLHRLMSCSVIRNVDVHMALYERLLANRDKLRKEGSSHGLSKLKDFIDSIITTDTPMKTYNVDGACHKISFWCLQPVVDFLADEMANADGRLLSIYNFSDEIETITNKLLINDAKEQIEKAYPKINKTHVRNRASIINFILNNSSPEDSKQARSQLRKFLSKSKYAKPAEFIAELAEHVDELLTICPPKENAQN